MIGSDTTRFVLLLALAMVAMLLWQAWEKDYGVKAPQAASQETPATAATTGKPAPATTTSASGVGGAGSTKVATTSAPVSAGRRIRVRTDVFDIQIGTTGAGIRRVALPEYPVAYDKPKEPFVLLDDQGPEQYFMQGGLLSDEPAPNQEATFQTGRDEYVMAPGQDSLAVPFTWEQGGVRVTKTFHFTRGSYVVKVDYQVENDSAGPWKARAYMQVQRAEQGKSKSRVLHTYTGGVISAPDKRYEKIPFKDMKEHDLARDVSDGWVAMTQHYFLTALLPTDRKADYHYYTSALSGDRFAIGAMTPSFSVAPGGKGSAEEKLYVGPTLQDVLANTAPGLELTVDYGALWFIAKPLFWCLKHLRELLGNWGWAIILVTVMLKALFYKLSAAGYRSMANMRRVQPRIIALRERYKDDRQRLNQAMMQIYKEEKINPFGGCLPIVVQIPVFLSLYWVLLESVELRQAGFIFWLHDLSTPDPFWVLPLIMGVTMLAQQKLNPAPVDPVQQKVMMVMPFAFTIFFGFFPSGLVLYWVVNNILSIAQQWAITRSLESSPVRRKS